MAEIKVRLLKPLDGKAIGTTSAFSEADFKKLEAQGAVERVSQKAAKKPKNKKAPAPKNKSA